MDRMACVDVPALPLQIALRSRPEWTERPVAIVDVDKPMGTIEWVNERARAHRILPGMRYATALSLSEELRATAVDPHTVAEYVGRLTRWLWRFSPRVEPSSREPGVFWIDAGGLEPLYTSLQAWAVEVRTYLRDAGFEAAVAIGFSRFGSYAAARSHSGTVVFRDPDRECRTLRRVPLDRLGFDPALRDKLGKLGVRTLGGFIDLPAAGIRRRFGVDAHALHEMARGSGWEPLQPAPYEAPITRERSFDHPVSEIDRLFVHIGPLVRSILSELAQADRALTALALALVLDDRSVVRARVAPAAPTLDHRQIYTLIRLRLEASTLAAGVVEVELAADGSRATRRQLELFHPAAPRDFEAIGRAFAKIRADLGAGAVTVARLQEAHLPEGRFAWHTVGAIAEPAPADTGLRPVVRRLHTPAIALPHRARHEPDGWMVARMADGPIEEVVGPHIIAGGWWMREVSRAYHYVRTKSGRWLWVYHDHRRRRWFLHAEVE